MKTLFYFRLTYIQNLNGAEVSDYPFSVSYILLISVFYKAIVGRNEAIEQEKEGTGCEVMTVGAIENNLG